MDFQFWLYVIIGVIYLISRLVKKPASPTDFPDYGPENPVPKSGKHQQSPEQETPRQLTFEELLREITEGKQENSPAPRPEYRPTNKSEPTRDYKPFEESNKKYSYEDEYKEDDQDLEEDVRDYRKDDQVVSAYEEAKRQAFLRPSLEETMNIHDTEMKFGRFKEFEQDKKRNLLDDYVGDLRNPDNWKKAIIMNEILKRKF